MEFSDIRRGSDLEFGQSIYEPFGISQIEPVNFGAISCVSNVCGCIGFVQQAADELVQQGLLPAGRPGDRSTHLDGRIILPHGGAASPVIADQGFPFVIADYISLAEGQTPVSPQDALAIDGETRGSIEAHSSEGTAGRIFARLPNSRAQRAEMIRIGSALASGMSWDTVVENSFLLGLTRICKQ